MVEPDFRSDSRPEDGDSTEFVRLLNAHHRKLLGYLVALVGHRDDAEDVLQRASVTMWKKFATYAPGTDFLAWASTVAYYEARNFLRVSGRSRVTFSDALLELLAEDRTRDLARQDARLEALARCLQRLDSPARNLVHWAYVDNTDIAALAARLGRAPQTLYNKLCAIRRLLADCVESRLGEGGRA